MTRREQRRAGARVGARAARCGQIEDERGRGQVAWTRVASGKRLAAAASGRRPAAAASGRPPAAPGTRALIRVPYALHPRPLTGSPKWCSSYYQAGHLLQRTPSVSRTVARPRSRPVLATEAAVVFGGSRIRSSHFEFDPFSAFVAFASKSCRPFLTNMLLFFVL